MGHYRSEMMEDFSGLSEQEKLTLEIQHRFKKEKKFDLINRNGVRVSKGSGGRLIFTPITDEEVKKRSKR